VPACGSRCASRSGGGVRRAGSRGCDVYCGAGGGWGRPSGRAASAWLRSAVRPPCCLRVGAEAVSVPEAPQRLAVNVPPAGMACGFPGDGPLLPLSPGVEGFPPPTPHVSLWTNTCRAQDSRSQVQTPFM